MIEGLILKSIIAVICLGSVTGVVAYIYRKGYKAKEIKILKSSVDDALKTTKDRAKRRTDSDDAVRERMRRNYTR